MKWPLDSSFFIFSFLLFFMCNGPQISQSFNLLTYNPNCEEMSLLSAHLDLAEISFQAALNAKFQEALNFQNTNEGTLADTFVLSLWVIYMTLGVYKLPGASWPVSTLEEASTWGMAVLKAHLCLTSSCCPTSPKGYSLMALQNGMAGVQFLLNNQSPLQSSNNYTTMLLDFVLQNSSWFNAYTNPNGALCFSNSTFIYYNPNPVPYIYDPEELDECAEAATLLSFYQARNFHSAIDQDWIYFCPIQGEKYTISVSQFGPLSPYLKLILNDTTLISTSGNITWTSTVTNQTVYVQITNLNSSLTFPVNYNLNLYTNQVGSCPSPSSKVYDSQGYALQCPNPTCYNVPPNQAFPSFYSTSQFINFTMLNISAISGYQISLETNITYFQYELISMALQEIDDLGGKCASVSTILSKQYQHGTVLFGNNQISSTSFNITSTLSNCAVIETSTFLLQDPSSNNYGSNVLNFLPDTLKMAFNISNWPFASSSHHLVYTFLVNSSHGVTDSNQNFQVDPEGNIVTVQTDTIPSWIFRFLTQVLVDGEIQNCSVKLVPVTISPPSAHLIFEFPSFKNYLYYDPDFTVLLGNNNPVTGTVSSPTGNQDQNNQSHIVTILAVVFTLVAVIMIVVAALLIFLRRRKSTQELIDDSIRMPQQASRGLTFID